MSEGSRGSHAGNRKRRVPRSLSPGRSDWLFLSEDRERQVPGYERKPDRERGSYVVRSTGHDLDAAKRSTLWSIIARRRRRFSRR